MSGYYKKKTKPKVTKTHPNARRWATSRLCQYSSGTNQVVTRNTDAMRTATKNQNVRFHISGRSRQNSGLLPSPQCWVRYGCGTSTGKV